MGYFSQLDMEKRTAETCADDETTEMDLRAKAEEIDDAKQAAEAKAAQATLAKLAETEAPPEDEADKMKQRSSNPLPQTKQRNKSARLMKKPRQKEKLNGRQKSKPKKKLNSLRGRRRSLWTTTL